MSKIIIQLDGGLVQDVFLRGTGKITNAIIVDEDVEMCDPDNIVTTKIKGNKTYAAAVHTNPVSNLPKGSDVDNIVKEFLKKGRKDKGHV
ncbi:MAG: hypothetical protein IMZ61_11535 [Planctomycetes bacterium]|nr:hypothetical protein [Planctomycetota bacterium]